MAFRRCSANFYLFRALAGVGLLHPSPTPHLAVHGFASHCRLLTLDVLDLFINGTSEQTDNGMNYASICLALGFTRVPRSAQQSACQRFSVSNQPSGRPAEVGSICNGGLLLWKGESFHLCATAASRLYAPYATCASRIIVVVRIDGFTASNGLHVSHSCFDALPVCTVNGTTSGFKCASGAGRSVTKTLALQPVCQLDEYFRDNFIRVLWTSLVVLGYYSLAIPVRSVLVRWPSTS
jgi:hypothetical protein